MIGLLVMLVIVAGGGALAAKLAREQGRSVTGWAALTVVAGVAGSVGGGFVVAGAVRAQSETLALAAALAAPALSMVLETGAIVGLMAWARRGPALSGSSWPTHVLQPGDYSQEACRLYLGPDAVIVEHSGQAPLRLALGEIVDVTVDGECLRLDSPRIRLELLPGGEEMVHEPRVRLSESLRGEIMRRRVRAAKT